MKKRVGISLFIAGLAVVLPFQNCSNTFRSKSITNLGSSENLNLSSANTPCDGKSGTQAQSCLEVSSIYTSTLSRDPSTDEITHWLSQMAMGSTLTDVRISLASTPEAKQIQLLTSSSTQRKIHWGAFIGGIPSGPGAMTETIDTFNNLAGKPATLFGFNTWWHTTLAGGDFNSTMKSWADSVSARGAMPVIMWNAFDPNHGLSCSDPAYLDHLKRFSNSQIAAGTHDAYIRKYAKQMAAWGKPVCMRTMHELNYKRVVNNLCSDYFTTWDAEVTINGQVFNTRADTVNAFRHIVDIFRSEGATNVKWMWSVLTYPSASFGGTNPISLKSIYPGDSYVDWIGIECYNFEASDFEGCSDRMRGIYNEAAALSPTRPILNVEMGSLKDSRKSAWITEAFSDSSAKAMHHMFPRLNGVMYWQDSRKPHELWLRSDTTTPSAFRNAITHAAYAPAGVAGQLPCAVSGLNIAHGASQLLYKNTTSENCTADSQTRTCNNGQLGGSDMYHSAVCVESLSQAEAQAAAERLLSSVLGRTAEEVANDPAGVAYWAEQIKNGMSEAQVSASLRASNEFALRQAYLQYFNRPADGPGLAYFLAELKAGRKTLQQAINDIRFAAMDPPPLVNQSCVVGTLTLSSGSSAVFYNALAATTCTPQTRTCNNGTMSGSSSYQYSSCKIAMSDSAARSIVSALMVSVFNRTAQEMAEDTAGVTYWADQLKNGMTEAEIRSHLLASDEYFVRQAYINELKRNGDSAGVKYYVAELKAKRKTRAQVTADLRYICANKIGGECS